MSKIDLTKIGGTLFTLGAVSTLITVGAWLLTGTSLSVWAYYIAMLMPLGFALIAIEFVVKIRRRARGRID